MNISRGRTALTLGGDVTGGSRADLVAPSRTGTLWLYVNRGSNTAPYSTGSQIGVSWEQFTWFLATT